MKIHRRPRAPLIALLGLAYCCLQGFACGQGKAGQPAEASSNTETAPAAITPSQEKSTEPLPPRHIVTNRIEITTSEGTVVVGLYGKDAPNTVANFLTYVKSGFYTGKIFHRIIPGFMIQGGGFDATLNRLPTRSPIRLELIPGLEHTPGIISMARTSNPHSATSQFFLCVGDTPQLNGAYAAFGKVEKGYEVVEKISRLPTKTAESERGPMADVPENPVTIEKITEL
jgi:peptidyl-prolyl cis-trans isomerase A (cyclophilin A)